MKMNKNETHKEKMMRKKLERKNRNVTITKMKTEIFVMKTEIPCIRDFGFGWMTHKFTEGLDIEVTNLKLEPNPNDEEMGYSFELWDEEGWIGNYKVPKSEWENSVEKIA
jgi:hypothetical protein